MIDRILVAVDGSDQSRRAAMLGLALAKPYDVEVDALHAVEGGVPTGTVNKGEEVQDDSGDEILAEISEMADDVGVAVTTHMVKGQASEIIIRQARESGADLIVMGRQGRTGVGERLLGSVTERVLRNTDVPVLIIPNDDPIDTEDVTYTHVLATTDGSEIAERAAPYAADIAHQHRATLHVITVVDIEAEGGAFSAGGVSEEFIEQREEQGRESVDRFSERISRTDAAVDLHTTVIQGTPHVAIDEYVADNDIDLIVMASQGESGLTGQLLGSVADQVLRVINRPVLLVPASE